MLKSILISIFCKTHIFLSKNIQSPFTLGQSVCVALFSCLSYKQFCCGMFMMLLSSTRWQYWTLLCTMFDFFQADNTLLQNRLKNVMTFMMGKKEKYNEKCVKTGQKRGINSTQMLYSIVNGPLLPDHKFTICRTMPRILYLQCSVLCKIFVQICKIKKALINRSVKKFYHLTKWKENEQKTNQNKMKSIFLHQW